MGLERYDYDIKMKQNNDPFRPDSLTLYKKEIQLWEEGKQLQDLMSSKGCGDVGEASSPPRKKPKCDAFAREIAQQIAPEIAEKLGTLLRRSREENEEKIRVLELKIKNLEAHVVKVNSELGAALERSEIFQGKADSSEAREKKLKSDLKAALERIGILQGEIKSSEACENKLKSELKAAVEMNAKLEGGINHAISSLENLVKKSEEARDDHSTLHEAEGDLQEEVHPEKHMVVENSGKKDTAGNTELKSNSVGEGSHVKDSTTGKSTKFSSSSISEKEAEPKSKAKKDNEEATTKGTSSSKLKSSKSSEREQGKGESVTAVAEKEPSREEMQSVVADILRGVDFNTVTTTTLMPDIVNQIGNHFGLDLMHRRAEVEELVVDEVIESLSND